MRPIDADALFAVVKGHHDLYKGATNPADKARRDECLQVMCDINDALTIDAIPVEWLNKHKTEYLDDWGENPITVEQALKMWQKQEAE